MGRTHDNLHNTSMDGYAERIDVNGSNMSATNHGSEQS
jgi:hypothetical protein